MKTQNSAMLMAMYLISPFKRVDTYLARFDSNEGNFEGGIRQHKKNVSKRIKQKKVRTK